MNNKQQPKTESKKNNTVFMPEFEIDFIHNIGSSRLYKFDTYLK